MAQLVFASWSSGVSCSGTPLLFGWKWEASVLCNESPIRTWLSGPSAFDSNPSLWPHLPQVLNLHASLATRVCWSILYICALPLCSVNCNPTFKIQPMCPVPSPQKSSLHYPGRLATPSSGLPYYFISLWSTYHTYPIIGGCVHSSLPSICELCGDRDWFWGLTLHMEHLSPGHNTSRHSQVFVSCCSKSQSYK